MSVALPSRLAGSPVSRRIVFLRHGQTAFNHGAMVDGRSQNPLNALGRRQAEAAGAEIMARRLVGQTSWRLISSPLQRARETAALAFPSAVALIEPDFAEVDVGALQGIGWTEATARGIVAADHDFTTPFSGGESYETAQRRAAAALERRIEECEGDLVVVAHGGIIVLMILSLLEIPGRVFPFAEIDNGSISVVELHRFGLHRAAKLKALNHTPF